MLITDEHSQTFFGDLIMKLWNSQSMSSRQAAELGWKILIAINEYYFEQGIDKEAM